MSHSIWSVGGLESNGRTVPSFNTIWVYIFSWLLFVSHLTRFVLDDNFSLSLHIFSSSSSSLGAKGLSVFIHLIVSVWIYFRYSLHNKYIKVFHTDTPKTNGKFTGTHFCQRVFSFIREAVERLEICVFGRLFVICHLLSKLLPETDVRLEEKCTT